MPTTDAQQPRAPGIGALLAAVPKKYASGDSALQRRSVKRLLEHREFRCARRVQGAARCGVLPRAEIGTWPTDETEKGTETGVFCNTYWL